MGVRTRWIGALLGASAALAAEGAQAAPSARLVYVRNADTETCPDETAVRAAVSARLGYDPFFPSANETMFIELSREKGGYRARVKLVDEKNNVRGTREITEKGRSCSAIIDTLALSISIAIDPDSLTRSPKPRESERAPRTEPEPPPAPPLLVDEPVPAPPAPSPPSSLPAPRRDTRRPHLELLLLPAGWIGTGPSLAFGGELGARVRWEHLSLGLEARGDLPASRTVRGVDVEMTFLGGSLIGCGHLSALFACARATLGSISATSNAAVARESSALRFLVGPTVGAEIPVGETFRFVGRLHANVALDRETVVLNSANAYELPRLSGGLEIGCLVRF